MKKLDKLDPGFLSGGHFYSLSYVVDFILLTVNMLKYFDENLAQDPPF